MSVDPTSIARSYVHRRRARSSSENVQEFKDRAAEEDDFDGVKAVADELLPSIDWGFESSVYWGSEDTVIKISKSAVNLRAEYVTFINPEFSHVTPEAYDHGEEWRWIEVEKVDEVFPTDLFDYLEDSLREWLNFKSHAESEWDVSIDIMIGSVAESVASGDPPHWFHRISRRERRFFQGVGKLHKKLGLKPDDLRIANLGFDRDDNLVIIDIYTDHV